MAGWSSLNRCSSSFIDIEVKSIDECEERIRRLFDKALLVFLEEEGSSSYRRLPVILGDGKKVDLFELFVLVRERGGFDSVSKKGLWGLVAEKLGLDRLVSPFLRLIYFKYLNRIEKWAMESSKIVVWENQDCKKNGCYGAMLHELGEGFKGLLENGTCRKLFRNHANMVVGCESSLDDFHRAMKRSRVSSHSHHDGERLEVSCVALSDDFAVSTKVQGLDKKKGDLSKMLKWLTLAARSPEDPSIGVIPHHSKWNKYNTGNAYWSQLVRARNALIVQRDYPEFKGNQTLHRSMYSSLYDDDDQKSIARKQPDQTDFEIRPVKEGPKHQAQVDEWTGTSSASDTKWLGTCIWPLKNETFEDGLVGKGRPDSCSCDSSISNSIECVRFHIAEKRMELKRELGDAFFKWRFNEMGEEVSLRWTQKQEKRFKEMMIADPLDFWKKAARCFKGKKTEEIVSYYFNVFLINKRRYQNRVAPSSIDSDDEGSFGSVGRRFGNDAVTSFDSDIMICSQNRQCD